MREELKQELLFYLGELYYTAENSYDWFERKQTQEKIKDIHSLLEIEYKEKSIGINYKHIIDGKNKK